MRLDLISTMKDIQINSNLDAHRKFGSSIKAPCLKISSHGISLRVVDHEDHLNQRECQRIEINPKEKDCENHRTESELES